MGKAGFYVPLGIFGLLVVILAVGFTLEDPHYLPSVMIDQEIPEFQLASLHDEQRQITNEDLKGEVSLLNVWATWCPNCVVEHPELMRISREENVRLIGVNYNDESVKAITWLKRREDPYEFNIFDNEGKLGINLGVYGAPETYIVDSDGVVRYRHVGAVTRKVWEEDLEPLVELLQNGGAAGDKVAER
ncbi:MAG: DsbE family thiol:disulfide interchange protein [Pseudomonadales bacterium]|nr:DsbE family thiol:disulfide interchange protein [Pseudomonadales bacterium]